MRWQLCQVSKGSYTCWIPSHNIKDIICYKSKGANETKQFGSYSRSIQSTISQNSTWMCSIQTRAKLVILKTQNETLEADLKLIENSKYVIKCVKANIFILAILEMLKKYKILKIKKKNSRPTLSYKTRSNSFLLKLNSTWIRLTRIKLNSRC